MFHSYEIAHLKLFEWTGKCIDVGQLQHWFPRLRTLDIRNSSNLTSFKGYFKASSHIQVLDLFLVSRYFDSSRLLFRVCFLFKIDM